MIEYTACNVRALERLRLAVQTSGLDYILFGDWNVEPKDLQGF